MADSVTAKNEGGKFTPHPEGVCAAVCVDVIDLGEKVEHFPPKPQKLSPKVALIFQTGKVNPDTQKPYEIQTEFTVSMYENANLRKFLQQWRGKPYTDEQADKGVPLHKLVGQTALLTIAQQKAKNSSNIYANIAAICPLPEEMKSPVLPAYTRAPYWAEKKAGYAKAADALKQTNTEFAEQFAEEAFPEAFGADDDLPFS